MGKRKKVFESNKILHPKGRKTAQIMKKTIRASGRNKAKLHHQMKKNLIGEKILWFKENLDQVDYYTPQLTIDLIEKYLRRFDEELEQIKLKQTIGHRKGRQHASREDIINMTIKNEKTEFSTCGLEIPNLLNPVQLNKVRCWDGELRLLQHFELVRYTRDKLENMKNSFKIPNVKRKKSLDTKIADKDSEGLKG